MEKLPILALIIPCYNESELINDTQIVLNGLLEEIIRENKISEESFMVFVDDGSTDDTFKLIRASRLARTRIIKFSKNRGHQYAILAGLQYVTNKCDCVVSIDADLQDDLAMIAKMIGHFTEGSDIVYGVKLERKGDSIFKKITAGLYYSTMKKMGVNILRNHADFRLLSNKALIELEKYTERNIFLRGLFPIINLPTSYVSYDLRNRSAGTTKYNIYKMLSLAIRGVTDFTTQPIRIITIVGIFLFFITMVLSVRVCVVYIQGGIIPGWASITLPMYFLGGIQLLSLGIIGEYISKIYTEVKNRPLYHIEEIVQ